MIINSLGAAKNFPLEFRFSPHRFLGLALPHPCVEQGIFGIKAFLTHTPISFHKRGSMTGSFLQLSLEQLQLEIGTPEPVFEVCKDPYEKTATDCYVTMVWGFLSAHRGTSLRQEGDVKLHIPPV